MNNENLKEAIGKYIESKELVLMAYPPEYIEDVKKDMEISFRYGAEWMARQGVTKEAVIGMATEEIAIYVSRETLNELDLCPGDKVVAQIRKK